MRRPIFFAAGLTAFACILFAASACDDDITAAATPEGEGVDLVVSFRGSDGSPLSKSTVAYDVPEGGVRFADIYAFRKEDGILDAHVRVGTADASSSQTGGTVRLTAGERTICVVANCASLPSSVSKLSDLSAVIDVADMTAASGIPMTGKADVTVSGAGGTVEVDLTRLAAKVEVAEGALKLADGCPATTLRRVYPVNVPGKMTCRADGASTVTGNPWLDGGVSSWYNRLGSNYRSVTLSTGIPAIYDGDMDLTLSSAGLSKSFHYYCLPDTAKFSVQDYGGWRSVAEAQSCVCLVLEVLQDADGDGTAETRYYTIPISGTAGVKANSRFLLGEVNLLHAGKTTIEPSVSGDVTLSFNVVPWVDAGEDEGFSGTQTL